MKTTSRSLLTRLCLCRLLTLSCTAAPITNWTVRPTTGELTDLKIPASASVHRAWTQGDLPLVLTPPMGVTNPAGLSLSFAAGPSLNNAFPRIEYDPFAWPDADFRTMIRYGSQSPKDRTLTIDGLIAGQTYQIQIFGSDTRSCCAGRSRTYGDGQGHNTTLNSGSPSGGGQHVIGSWIADAATQRISLLGTPANPAHYNAIIVLNITQLQDSDNDEMSDDYEDICGLNKNASADRNSDLDGDTLSNITEYLANTRADLPDSDADGIRDDRETKTGIYLSVNNTGTDPVVPDSDGDGLSDGAETKTGIFLSAAQTGTNPNLTDSDNDGYHDGLEVIYSSSNPNRSSARPVLPNQLDLLAYWPFNNDSNPFQALDTVKNLPASVDGAAVYVAGRTGTAGDKAINFGSAAGFSRVLVEGGRFMRIASVNDEISISYWQWLDSIGETVSFFGQSPGIPNERGYAGSVPYSDNNIYFDTGGLGTLSGDRVFVNIGSPFTLGAWHHFVFQKKRTTKEIWRDGQLLLSGVNTDPLVSNFEQLVIGSGLGTEHIRGRIDDFAVFGDSLTPAQIAQLFAGASPPSLITPNPDLDGDGMPDAYESANGLNPAVDDADSDLDTDGSSNFNEYVRGTRPNLADTDGDGLPDGIENGPVAFSPALSIFVDLTQRGTSPLLTDTDADGLTDAVEDPTLSFAGPNQPGTSPVKRDSDADNWTDREEILLGTNPADSLSMPTPRPGGLQLLAYWPFDDNSQPGMALDVQRGFPGVFEGTSTYSAPGAGRTQAGTDRSILLGSNPASAVSVNGPGFLKLAAVNDEVSVSFWQWSDSIAGVTCSFWGISPGTPNARGFQCLTPYSDRNVYFDTGGTGELAVDRVYGTIGAGFTTGVWHHWVLQKRTTQKEVWLDGVLIIAGTNSAVLPNDFTKFLIGGDGSGSSVAGRIDDFAVFGSALDPTQIGQLAAGASPPSLLKIPLVSAVYNPAARTMRLTWNSLPERTYRVEASTNLAAWSTVLNPSIPSAGETTEYLHPTTTFPGGAPAKLFYRVVENP
jgi:Concanavalin A-like lectin/glucanases superfamily/Bacterial TSP3 repeat